MKTKLNKIVVAASISLFAMGGTSNILAADFVNVLTGGTSGVYYPIGVALSQIYDKALPGTKTAVQATKASVENLNLIQAGRGEVAITLGDSLADAVKGTTDAGFKAPLTKLRTIAPLHTNYIQMVALSNANIKTIKDLKGKRVSVGAPKSGTELNAREIFAGAGMSYADLGKVEYLGYSESVELMKNKQLDATLQSSGLGMAALKDLAINRDVTFVEIPKEVVTKINSPAYQSGIIPAKTYAKQDTDVVTAAIQNYLVTSSDVSEDDVYMMTKAMWENLPALHAAHSATKEFDINRVANTPPAPYHPGALKYYKEVGAIK